VGTKREQKPGNQPSKSSSETRRAQPGDRSRPTLDEQVGATEQEVIPMTPPMAESDQMPGQPNRKKDDELSPTDELTPG
jgi:hypothetical protein